MAESGETLSERELDVLRCVAGGASNKQIASDLSISQNTVKVHLRNIYVKLDVSSRTEAATAAIHHGYIAVPGHSSVEAVDSELQVATETVQPAKSAIPIQGLDVATKDKGARKLAQQNWRILALLLLLLLSAIAILVLAWQLTNKNQVTEVPEPFQAQPIGDTHWLTSRPMPEGRSNMAVAAVGLDVYQIGGQTAAGVDGKVHVFNSRDAVWREAEEKPTAVADASAVELYGELYVVGGRQANGQPTATVEAYSPSQDAWRPIAALPQPIAGGLTLSDGAFLYTFGGWDGKKALNTAFVYDPSADSWRPLPSMPHAQAFAAGGALAGKLVVAGGTDGQSELSTCHVFDPISEEWSGCPTMLQPRAAAGSAVLLNKLYVIGGGLNSENEITFSEVYDPIGETWQVVNTPTLVDTAGWPFPGVSQVETRIYALGGRKGDTYLDETLIYAPLVYQTYIPAATSGDE
jgi:DNA-binding CsgD family transcriptional regulator